MITLTNRQVTQALNRQGRLELPWPRAYLGEYGSHVFDGSPTTPQGEDAAMQRWASEIGLPPGFGLAQPAMAGRRADGVPVVVISIRPAEWPYGAGY